MFVTGLEYDNGRVGYFLADENFENWVPINSFEEYLKYNPDFQVDIPNTQDNFKEFFMNMNIYKNHEIKHINSN